MSDNHDSECLDDDAPQALVGMGHAPTREESSNKPQQENRNMASKKWTCPKCSWKQYSPYFCPVCHVVRPGVPNAQEIMISILSSKQQRTLTRETL